MAGSIGIGAGVGVAAAEAAIALVITSSLQEARSRRWPRPPRRPRWGRLPAARPPPVPRWRPWPPTSRRDTQATGDAWLVISTQVDGTKTMQVLYTLYTDSGAIYSGNSLDGIKHAIARHQDQMHAGGYAPLVKAAVLAAAQPRRWPGHDAQSRRGSAGRPPPRRAEDGVGQGAGGRAGHHQGEGRHGQATAVQSPGRPAAPRQHLWTYSTEALSAGDGNPLVRQGVLRLLSTISGVSVASRPPTGRPR